MATWFVLLPPAGRETSASVLGLTPKHRLTVHTRRRNLHFSIAKPLGPTLAPCTADVFGHRRFRIVAVMLVSLTPSCVLRRQEVRSDLDPFGEGVAATETRRPTGDGKTGGGGSLLTYRSGPLLPGGMG